MCAQAGANSAEKSLINEEKVTNTRVTVLYKAGKLSDSHSVGTAGSSKSREDQVPWISSQIN